MSRDLMFRYVRPDRGCALVGIFDVIVLRARKVFGKGARDRATNVSLLTPDQLLNRDHF